jgi:hypothetical protein
MLGVLSYTQAVFRCGPLSTVPCYAQKTPNWLFFTVTT